MKVHKTSTVDTQLAFGRTKEATGFLSKTAKWGFFYAPTQKYNGDVANEGTPV